jgi:hypothetical protein
MFQIVDSSLNFLWLNWHIASLANCTHHLLDMVNWRSSVCKLELVAHHQKLSVLHFKTKQSVFHLETMSRKSYRLQLNMNKSIKRYNLSSFITTDTKQNIVNKIIHTYICHSIFKSLYYPLLWKISYIYKYNSLVKLHSIELELNFSVMFLGLHNWS